ncbi:MAG: TfuA-like protein [Candidatus Omnitrophota bacterium]
MKTLIFGGPTISEQAVKEILVDAIFLPPVKHADILGVMAHYNPDVIGIIDGIIRSELSVWHKEILFALASGIRVFGAGGMGALRAAELDKFGMSGTGQVYERYKNGELEDDDEVFVKFEEKNGNYIRLSEPMVNLRETFKMATQHKIIDTTTYAALIESAKSLFYTDRSFENIFKRASEKGINPRQFEKLKAFTEEFYVDLLKQDALDMLREIAQLSSKDIPLHDKWDTDFSRYNTYFAPFYERIRPVRYEELEFPLYYISNYLCLYHPDIEKLNAEGLNREITLYLADLLQIEVNAEDIENEVSRFRSKYELKDDQVFEKWRTENDLPEKDFRCFFEKQAQIRKMQTSFFISSRILTKNTSYLMDGLKLENKYVEWKEKVGKRERCARENDAEFKAEFSKDNFAQLQQIFEESLQLPWNVPFEKAVEEMGMRKNDIKMEWIKEYLYRRYLAIRALELLEN